jgi:hypothetical protein
MWIKGTEREATAASDIEMRSTGENIAGPSNDRVYIHEHTPGASPGPSAERQSPDDSLFVN